MTTIKVYLTEDRTADDTVFHVGTSLDGGKTQFEGSAGYSAVTMGGAEKARAAAVIYAEGLRLGIRAAQRAMLEATQTESDVASRDHFMACNAIAKQNSVGDQ